MVEQVAVDAPPSRRRRSRAGRRILVALAVVVALVLVVAGATAWQRQRDLDSRAAALQLVWAADPARLAAAKAGAPYSPPVVPDSPWRTGGNTLLDRVRVVPDGLVASVVGGACDPHPWTVLVRWTDDLVVLDAVPDAPVVDLSVLGRLGPQGCTSNAVVSEVPVPLDRPLEGRLVVDAWSGAALVPPRAR